MAKTKGDCKKLFLNMIDNATKRGVALPETKNADYRAKFDYFLDSTVKYMAGIYPLSSTYTIIQDKLDNLIGDSIGFKIQSYTPDITHEYTVSGAKSYFLEINGTGTITISVNGTVVKTINNTTKGKFTSYKGNITANTGDSVKLSFIGDYPYSYKNIALFGFAYPTDTDVPDYRAYMEYDVPSDFLKFDNITLKTNPLIFGMYQKYKWEHSKKIIIPYNDFGTYDIHYFRYPATIAVDASDDTIIDAEENTVELIVMECAVKATAADDPSLSNYIRSLFQEQASNVSYETDKQFQTSIDIVYSILGY